MADGKSGRDQPSAGGDITARKQRIALLAFFAGLYGLSAPGTFHGNADTVLMFGVTHSLVTRGDLAVAPAIEAEQPPAGGYEHLRGADDRLYSPKGMSYSVALAPFHAAGHIVARAAGPQAARGRPAAWIEMLAASFAGPLLAALLCVVLFDTVRVLGFSDGTALRVALIAGAGTIVWAEAKSTHTETFHGLLIALAWYALLRLRAGGGPGCAASSGAAVATLVLSQPAMVVLVLPMATLALLAMTTRLETSRARRLASLAAYAIPVAVGLLILGAVNAARYGSPFRTGYEWADPTPIPLAAGLYGLLLSPGKSLLLYSPPLILALAASPAFVRRTGLGGAVPWALFAVFLVVYGRISWWHGDGAWGPRYLNPLVAPLCAALALPFATSGATRADGCVPRPGRSARPASWCSSWV